MSDPNDIWLCEFESNTSLLFDLQTNGFRISVSKDNETQSRIERRFLEADDYFAEHPEHRDMAMKAIADYLATNPAHEIAMKAAMSRIKSL